MRKRKHDDRPICNCSAYPFPHRIGGRCTGSAFTEFYFYNVRSACQFCNCNAGDHCDVATGQESISEAECYIEAKHYNPGEHLQLELKEPSEDDYPYCPDDL